MESIIDKLEKRIAKYRETTGYAPDGMILTESEFRELLNQHELFISESIEWFMNYEQIEKFEFNGIPLRGTR